MTFIEKLNQAWRSQNSMLCVGLDPALDRLPAMLTGSHHIFDFNREIIDATAQYTCAYKPQNAYYVAVGAEDQLSMTIDYIQTHYPHIPVILDAKRGDIGVSAKMYAQEAFVRYNADAVTVNPYMGGDTLAPFLEYIDRGVIALCRTSNPGSGDLQQLSIHAQDETIAMRVAQLAATEWNSNSNISLVVGATYPEEIARVRKMVGDIPLLIPGIGAQGGDLEAVVKNGVDSARYGLMISASRSIIYASSGADFAKAAGAEAARLCQQINAIREEI